MGRCSAGSTRSCGGTTALRTRAAVRSRPGPSRENQGRVGSVLGSERAITGRQDLRGAFCDEPFQTARNSLILKRRYVGAVDRARLESDSGERYQATSNHRLAASPDRKAHQLESLELAVDEVDQSCVGTFPRVMRRLIP